MPSEGLMSEACTIKQLRLVRGGPVAAVVGPEVGLGGERLLGLLRMPAGGQLGVGLQRACACTTDNELLGIGGMVVAMAMLPTTVVTTPIFPRMRMRRQATNSQHITAYHSRCWWVARRKARVPGQAVTVKSSVRLLLSTTAAAAVVRLGVYLMCTGCQCEEHLFWKGHRDLIAPHVYDFHDQPSILRCNWQPLTAVLEV